MLLNLIVAKTLVVELARKIVMLMILVADILLIN